MQQLYDFYSNSLNCYSRQCERVQRRLKLLSFSRVGVFIAILMVLFVFRNTVLWATLLALIGMGFFLFLIRYYEDVKTKYRLLHALVKINHTEIEVLQHKLAALPEGDEYIDPEHEYSHDLDLFGKGSFFQYLNRTQIEDGRQLLAGLLTSNDITAIVSKQEAIDELAQKQKWREHFTAHAMVMQQSTKTADIIAWLSGYTPFVPNAMRFLPWLFLGVSLIFGALAIWGGWSWSPLLYWMLLGLGITGRYFARIRQLTYKADRIKATFKQYAKLLKIVEETDFKAGQLRYQKQKLKVDGKKASMAIAQLAKLLNTMDYNHNMFYALIGNGSFLGALRTAYLIEAWITEHKSHVADWFGVIAFFDAYNSLGNFSFNHPLYRYPVIQNGPVVLGCKKAGHPLIPFEKNIKNDFEINNSNFFIITGSNMAGKSTFLRTVGLSMVMANLGLPVCAEECVYWPRKLVTSMRSMDSLYKGDSYFLSELKRLKKVIRLLEKAPYFVLLDEILKGTNSMDKASGSKRFLGRLIKAKATGLIATHDLSLCAAALDFKHVFNYYLDASIEDGELYFDYLLKKGVSKTMNATFLLEQMDIV